MIGGFFSYTGLDTATKWSSVIGMFVALATFALSVLLFRQSEAASSSKYTTTIYGAEHVSIGPNQSHITKVIKKVRNVLRMPRKP